MLKFFARGLQIMIWASNLSICGILSESISPLINDFIMSFIFVSMSNNEDWDNINWQDIEEKVHEVQQQIFAAASSRNKSQVFNLQCIIINMYETKLLAVRNVTQTSRGKTLGIENWIVTNSQDKYSITRTISLDGTTSFIRRFYMSNSVTNRVHLLGIATVIDMCKQTICKFALEPEFEALADLNSFGFRAGRSAIDAIFKLRAHLILNGPCYILHTGVKKCFDRLNHEFLLQKINAPEPINSQLRVWLKAGIFDKDQIIFPTLGTLHSEIISPLLANKVLDGLQVYISTGVEKLFGYQLALKTYFIRYADDFIIASPHPESFNNALQICTSFLEEIGLSLKSEESQVVHTLNKKGNKISSQHFDFLGFRFKQRYLSKHIPLDPGDSKRMPIRTLVLISPDRIERHKASVRASLKEVGNIKSLIKILNPRISAWCNYFKHSDAKEYGDLPRKMDIWINIIVRKWMKKNTKLRGKVPQFWKKDNKSLVLYYTDKEKNEITLTKYNSYKWRIYDYKAINSNFSPFKLVYKEFKNLI